MYPQRLWGCLILCAATLLVGCRQSEQVQPKPTTGKPVYQATGKEGRIVGVVDLKGKPPAPRKVSMNADPVCNAQGTYTTEDVSANNGRLQNVFVYVKSGLPADVTFPPAQAEVALQQKDCRYVPHVLGLHTDATLLVQSSDDTTHNVHPKPAKNREWDTNIAQGDQPYKKQFKQPEVMIPVKCGIHNWMSAWIGVLNHPFFAVTDAEGKFSLAGLPPGEYELEAWHEVYQTQTLKVTVAANGEGVAEFKYDTAAAPKPGKLTPQAAVVVP